ncbi:uncharacterized protein LOC110093018 [Dendrobium catenatum]|uniref:uncharacterized protein LOC110093018 n=1 Tax=Dendrobium catenatum TaxID=906689 RepID=UPI0010A041F9|nr:uncharacterized protein LOC110093018 [Dendrobium catenatum]
MPRLVTTIAEKTRRKIGVWISLHGSCVKSFEKYPVGLAKPFDRYCLHQSQPNWICSNFSSLLSKFDFTTPPLITQLSLFPFPCIVRGSNDRRLHQSLKYGCLLVPDLPDLLGRK